MFVFLFWVFGRIGDESILHALVEIILMLAKIIDEFLRLKVLHCSSVFHRQNLLADVFVQRWIIGAVKMNLFFQWLTQHRKHHRYGFVEERRRVDNMNFHIFDWQQLGLGWGNFDIAWRQPLEHSQRETKKWSGNSQNLIITTLEDDSTHPLMSIKAMMPLSTVSLSFNIVSNHMSSSCASSTGESLLICAVVKLMNIFYESFCVARVEHKFLWLTDSSKIDSSAFLVTPREHVLCIVIQQIIVLIELSIVKPFRIFVLRK